MLHQLRDLKQSVDKLVDSITPALEEVINWASLGSKAGNADSPSLFHTPAPTAKPADTPPNTGPRNRNP